MAITQEEFDHLVQRLERFSQHDPKQYRLRVALLAILGYGYIALILAGLLVGIGLVVLLAMSVRRVNSFIVNMIVLLLVPAWMIVRSLWVKFSPPEGLPLDRHQVPQVFALVNELTTKLQAPAFHNILLTSDFNAAVMQVPRLGVFGWQENYLILGLPLLQALTLEQLKAVLAHEIGHLSGNHSRFGGWIYRQRKTWLQLYKRIHESDSHQGATILFDRFLGWYFPLFNAYSFVLARLNEYDADRCAVELAGPKNAADVLISVEVKSRLLNREFWSTVYDKVADQPDPPDNAYSMMATALKRAIAQDQGKQWIQEALREDTTTDDTHPCFRDRLRALGYLSEQQLHPPTEITTSAAEELLGERVQDFVAEFNQSWKTAQATPWRQRYAYLSEVRAKLEALEQQAEFTDEQLWERACYVGELQGGEASVPYLKAVLERQPKHVEANYTLGELLLRQGNQAGIECVETAIAQQYNIVIEGCELMYNFYVQQGQPDKAEQCRDRAEQQYALLQQAEQERASVSPEDKLKPHTLSPDELDSLRQQLIAHANIKEAYLVEKVVTYIPEARFCVLGIFHKPGLLGSRNAAETLFHQIVEQLDFPIETYIVMLEGSELRDNICSVEGALVLEQ